MTDTIMGRGGYLHSRKGESEFWHPAGDPLFGPAAAPENLRPLGLGMAPSLLDQSSFADPWLSRGQNKSRSARDGVLEGAIEFVDVANTAGEVGARMTFSDDRVLKTTCQSGVEEPV